MPEHTNWLATDAFAELAQITPQAARKILKAGARGAAWRGHALVVRHRLGRGGRRGLGYEVAATSLPEQMQQASTHFSGEIEVRSIESERQTIASGALVGSRWQAIEEALTHPSHSEARAESVVEAALKLGLHKRTIYRWIAQYERHGMRGLGRARAAEPGTPRVVISRQFDHAFWAGGYDEGLLLKIAETVQKALKGLWASRAEQAGATEIRRLAEFLLLEACEANGVAVDRTAVRLSRRVVERFAVYRVVNQRRNDRKAFDDFKPRIRRDWTALAPMERVVADVKASVHYRDTDIR